MQPLSGNQRPDLLTSLMNMSLALRLPCETSLQILCIFPTPAIVFGNATKPSRFFSLLAGWRIPYACHAKRHLNVQKCSKPVNFLHFWWFDFEMCFAPQGRALFFDISTSKSALNLTVFYTFDFAMCFAPQRRALFRHVDFQKRSDTELLCTF